MEQAEMIESLREVSLLSRLEDAHLERLARVAHVEDIPTGGLYFSEQTAAQGFHLLLSGRVKLFKTSEEGREQTIFIFGPGEPFCLCSVFSDGVLPANLAALEHSRVLVIPPKDMDRLMHEDPSLLLMLLRVMSRRLKDAMEMIDSLSLKQLPSRLAAYFLAHASGNELHLGITQREFAKIIGATPEALSRSLKKMTEAGLVRLDGPQVRLLDLGGLQDCKSSGLGAY